MQDGLSLTLTILVLLYYILRSYCMYISCSSYYMYTSCALTVHLALYLYILRSIYTYALSVHLMLSTHKDAGEQYSSYSGSNTHRNNHPPPPHFIFYHWPQMFLYCQEAKAANESDNFPVGQSAWLQIDTLCFTPNDSQPQRSHQGETQSCIAATSTFLRKSSLSMAMPSNEKWTKKRKKEGKKKDEKQVK